MSRTGPRNAGLTSDGDGCATTMLTSGFRKVGAGRASCNGLPSIPRTTTSACADAAPTHAAKATTAARVDQGHAISECLDLEVVISHSPLMSLNTSLSDK